MLDEGLLVDCSLSHCRLLVWVFRLLALSCFAACQYDGSTVDGPGDARGSQLALISPSGVEAVLAFRSYVYVALDASDELIARTIEAQVQTARGALTEGKIAWDGRRAGQAVRRDSWRYELVTVLGMGEIDGLPENRQRVIYDFADRVVADATLAARGAFELTLLAGDYATEGDSLVQACSDGYTVAELLWHYFRPQLAACQARIQAEQATIAAAAGRNRSTSLAIPREELERRFLTQAARLVSQVRPVHHAYPAYAELFAARQQEEPFLIYLTSGVDVSAFYLDDRLSLEYLKFLQLLLAPELGFRLAPASPGQPLAELAMEQGAAPTLEELLHWFMAPETIPSSVANDPAARAAVRSQILHAFVERWLHWQMPVLVHRVEDDGQETSHRLLIELRSYHGDDYGQPVVLAKARGRYREASHKADILLYNGHSHLGGGAFDPAAFEPTDFKRSYQLFFLNSCSSYTHFYQGFFAGKPGGARELDIVGNGLPSLIVNSGEALAQFLIGVLSMQSYAGLLSSLEASDHQAMRLVDGEAGERPSPASARIWLSKASADDLAPWQAPGSIQ